MKVKSDLRSAIISFIVAGTQVIHFVFFSKCLNILFRIQSTIEEVGVEALTKSLEVLRPDGTPRPIEESPPLRALSGEIIKSVEEIIRTPASGELRYRQVSSSPVRDGSGSIIGSVSVVRDITEHRNSEDILKESEERFSNAFVSAAIGMALVSPDGRFLKVNESLCQMVGYSETELLVMTFQDITHPDDLETDLHFVHQMLCGEIPTYQMEKRYLHKSGNIIWVLLSVSLVRDSQENPLYFVSQIENITERKQAEEALKQANRQISFLTEITRHDIKNNLSVIYGSLGLAEAKCTDPALLNYLEIIQSATNAVLSQIDFTRVYQDLGSHQPQWQNLESVLPISAIPETIHLISDVSGIELYADPLLGKVFGNLLDNSIRHGEHVTEIRVSYDQSGHDIMIFWEDNGAGIQASEKELIFERGFGKNTGLGMFLVREILLLTSITIRETGEPGKGARFEIIVPPDKFRIDRASLSS